METNIRIIAEKIHQNENGAHDFQHVVRVVNLCEKISEHYSIDKEVLIAAAWLHDIGRTMPESQREGRGHAECSAEMAENILGELGFSTDTIKKIQLVIRSHSFSRGEVPETLEGKILQDADRLDAIGAIGIARALLHGVDLLIYHPEDPEALNRSLDDSEYILDHFPSKLFKLIDGFYTVEAKRIGRKRHQYIRDYYERMLEEIRGEM